MVELEAVSDAAVETLQRTFNDAIDNMIPKMPNLADMSDKLNDLRLRQTRRVETRRASSRVTGLVRSLHDVVSNGNFGAMIWKTDDILSISSHGVTSFNLLDMSARLGILGIMLSITSLN
ncbi:hypothetical protein L3X38_008341 [Prunus dulcis]|uniref:Uncharacterized protein n=1 Tax=Prunus dulcis TaxID=3755 RepID=A0AAD4ZWR1_PRUDU|nr:hypothetical protein L3X38_008341 [Prunus dulcis]